LESGEPELSCGSLPFRLSQGGEGISERVAVREVLRRQKEKGIRSEPDIDVFGGSTISEAMRLRSAFSTRAGISQRDEMVVKVDKSRPVSLARLNRLHGARPEMGLHVAYEGTEQGILQQPAPLLVQCAEPLPSVSGRRVGKQVAVPLPDAFARDAKAHGNCRKRHAGPLEESDQPFARSRAIAFLEDTRSVLSFEAICCCA
jgi:hypothetical protein